MKTILLTGATGFLGSNILKKILELDEYKVVILKRSFSDVFRISEIINRVKYYDIDLVPLENAFFSPKARLKMALNFTKHIDTLNIECNNKKKMIVVVFVQGLFLATFGYRSILNNSKLCKHYDINKRSLNVIDLTRIGYNFYLDFCQNSKSLNINRVEFEFKIAFNFLIYSYFKLKNKWFI